MKKLKYLSLFIILILAIAGIIFKDQIIAFAEDIEIEKIELNKVYNRGDNIVIYNYDEIGSGFDYDEVMEKTPFIAYEDKDGTLISFYTPLGLGSGFMTLPQVSIGYNCKENADVIFKKMMEENSENFEDMTEEEKEQLEQEIVLMKTYMCMVGEMYVGNNILLGQVDKWQVVESKYETIQEYCENVEQVKTSLGCTELITFDYGSGYYPFLDNPVITLREYVEPEFSLECNPTKVAYGKNTNCTLSVTTTDIITEIKTTLKSEHLDPQEVTPSEGWTSEKDKDGYYILKNEDGFTGTGKVLGVSMLATANVDKETAVTLEDISYVNSFNTTNTSDVSSKVTVEGIENPDTADLSIIIMVFILATATTLIITFYKRRKALS